jgi:hypothetical protein
MRSHWTLTRLLVAHLVAVTVTARPIEAHTSIEAQKPDRQQDARTPPVKLKAGWQLLFHDGCRFAVPGSWRADADGTFVRAPDGSNLSVRIVRITSWAAHKAQIRAAFGQVAVLHEDSDRRLWLEIGDKPRIQHYIDVANGPSACAGLLEVHTSTLPDAEDTVNRIADSIGPALDKWPVDFK